MFVARMLVKYMYDRLRENKANHGVFIYGCKSGGMMLAKAIRMEDPARFTLRGFISDSDDMP
jgi:FlaA1/EpsC-like NDP-sugar epimerase